MDKFTKVEIEKENTKILKEIGIKRPPARVEDILEYLDLHRRYYNIEDPNLLQRFWHKVEVQKFKFFKLMKKVKLVAMWFPNESEIYIDSTLPDPKQKWATHHEIEHRILPWHRSFYLGDTVQTLDPNYQEMLEIEANFGASYLMFCGDLFKKEALDTKPEWNSIHLLSKRYGNSMVTTLRRYVNTTHDIPMAAFISTPNWLEKPGDQENRYRIFDRSDKFKEQFGNVHPGILLSKIDDNTRKRRGGPIGDFSLFLKDINGNRHEFRAESFFNRHDVLTLLVYKTKLEILNNIIAFPSRSDKLIQSSNIRKFP
jgi:Zn-dependent peptidase ImmA (M78 family)